MTVPTTKRQPVEAVAENAIAVVGMACRYPGAGSVREFWTLLRDGVEGITHFGIDDLIAKGADPTLVRRPEFVPAKGYLEGSGNFDWPFFRYSRADAANIDPQQRVFLECASTAIDDAGLDPGAFAGRIGVYAGADRTPLDGGSELSPLVRVISHEKDFVATRVAYKLGLRGPAVTVQTACSTSLTAIHMATRALLGAECDVALAGGVAVSPAGEWGYLHEPGSILSRDGHCRPFDAAAAGTVPSEGVGVVVLKRLEDALRDGDRIAAVVRGSSLNNDGSDKLGFTAPSIPGQSEVIRHAQGIAGVQPQDIHYVECHGTATPMGDPVEVAALTDAFGPMSGRGHTTWLGAVKSNIGHTSAAAGVAGFIKTVLMLEHRTLVPTLHYRSPNPMLDLESSPFEVCTRTEPWPEGATPTAAVSAFGVGGTNAHVILQAAPDRPRPAPEPGPHVLMVSAASSEALERTRHELADHLESSVTLELRDVAHTLSGRRRHDHRQSFVAADRAEAVDQLSAAPRPPATSVGQIAFLFPGHGVLRHAAGVSAYRLLPDFRAAFDAINDFVGAAYSVDLTPLVAQTGAAREWFDDWTHQQLGLFTLGYALGRQLVEWGIKPAAMLGNSVGEYAAAALAGTWSPTDAAVLVHERAQGLRATEPGRMVAVNDTADEVARRVPSGSRVVVSMISRGGVVLSGPEAEMEQLLTGDALSGLDLRRLNVDRAAHCEIQTPVADRLTELITAMPTHVPDLPLISNVTGDWADPEAVSGHRYWAEQVRRAVQLDDGMKTLLGTPCDVFLELGPGSTMLSALRLRAEWDPQTHTGVPMLGQPDDGERGLLRALGTLWERSVDVVEPVLGRPEDRPLRCSLPGHPFAASDPRVEPEALDGGTGPARSPDDDRDPVRGQLAALWCRALGVAAAVPGENFFALGGESLMVLQLMTQVREKVGVVVPAAEFIREATFAHLLDLVERQRAGRAVPAADAALLREGVGRPLFLIADAAESSLSYLDLAEHVDTTRPVYGLEPQGVQPGRTSVEELAAEHVAVLLRTQPDGPYTIGGWSFGAMVAHEMACQLVEKGERVDMLVCLDAYVPGKPGRLLGASPDFLAGQLLLQVGATFGVGEVGAQIRRNHVLRTLLRDKFRVLARYRPRRVACPAVVLKAETDARQAQRLRRRVGDFYAGGVTVRPVGGNHWSMLRVPHAPHLARQLLDALPDEQPEEGGR